MIGIGVNIAAGLSGNVPVVDELATRARAVEGAGLDTLWLPQGYGFDALTAYGAIARETSRVELGASVVVVQPRHPRVVAAQAQTVQAASHGRFTLGLGVSHPGLLEIYGLPFVRPVAALRAHLDVLEPLLDGRSVPGTSGPGSTPADTDVPGAEPRTPVLLGALGPVMLALAGERASGTITFLCGPRTIGDHVVPHLSRATAGRPRRVVVGVPVAVTAEPERVRAEVAGEYEALGRLPSYAATLERDGFATPGDIAIAGDEDDVAAGIARYADAGATDLNVSLVGTPVERERTLAALGSWRRGLVRTGAGVSE
ncbi:TIGR03564 family F420-dependent LLM class oxidoreductase [Actinomycetospora termitidis]|uniref:TIGR03564 family F420-dependent LLM class oxidoreductase n=1 Tax=Actinomycetospora termitidis TaxID=3053470 RepID=A0ABT7MHH4_9PSEU|nr:TIGR03564 family F420-dependent LLM class oxidoreductase [Actinomycetospora sp. Odt1-22]MDL5160100.1 TIGR03564 family F420-dependent LLM class oxidoreductase [Actinomycetospora sp. Odt1-22]